MRRLAWFTPLPPVRSGIATYSTDVLPRLGEHYEIETFDETRAHDFVWQARTHPFDLTIYQLGNASCHDFMWPYLFRYPGLVVLHDAQLHQARAGTLLAGQPRRDDYRAEFQFNHPDARPEIAEFVIDGFGGVLYHFWPMRRLAVTSARSIAVHSRRLAAELQADYPESAIEHLRMGVAEGTATVAPARLRQRLGLAPDALVLAALGGVTPEKRLGPILRALRAVADERSTVHLLLVGDAAPYYDAMAEARTLGIDRHVTMTGFVPDEELPSYLDLADVCLCLRWPTSRETSASWLRCLARGKPTVVTDLVHTGDITVLDPRNWTVLQGEPSDARISGGPIAVAIDILDEDHSLRLALRRLSTDADLRRELGARAKTYWAAAHSLEAMADDYRAVIERACDRPAPEPRHAPSHLRRDGTELARRLLSDMQTAVDLF